LKIIERYIIQEWFETLTRIINSFAYYKISAFSVASGGRHTVDLHDFFPWAVGG